MRLNGGVLGASNQPTNRAASGVWHRYEQYTNVLYNTFPAYFPGYNLSTIQTAQTVYNGVNFAVGNQDNGPHEIFFSTDGTRMFMIGSAGNIFQYNLTTPWLVSSASYSGVSLSVAGQENATLGMTFKSDGTKMYVIGTTNDRVFQYTLSSAWSLSTATYDNVSFSVLSQDSGGTGIVFSTDGTKMFLSGSVNDRVYQYTLSLAWDVSTATYDNISFSVAAQTTTPQTIQFSQDGTKMFIMGSNDSVFEYVLGTAWNISTATYSTRSYSPSSQWNLTTETNYTGMYFRPNGLRFYIVGTTADRVYQIENGTAFTINPSPGYANFVSVTTQESIPQDLFFSPDGLQMYVVGSNSDAVYQYTMSIAWDVTTAVYSNKAIAVSGQEATPTGLFFKSDGTKMYVVGATSDRIHQYNLSTPWDLATASYDGISRLTTPQSGNPQAIFFGNNGLKLYVLDTIGIVFQYSLSTAWNLDTVTYDSISYSTLPTTINAAETATYGLFFSPDGSRMYVVGDITRRVYQYSLSVNWNISTATSQGVNYYLGSRLSTADGGIFFKPDGTKMFVGSGTSDRVHQFFLSP